MKIQLPKTVTSVSIAGIPLQLDEDNIVDTNTEVGKHLVECFGGEPVVEKVKKAAPPAQPASTKPATSSAVPAAAPVVQQSQDPPKT